MGVPLYTGFIGPVQQSWKVKYSPSTGGESSLVYHGFDANAMLTLAGAQARAGISCELEFAHNMAQLTLTTTNPTYQGFGSVFNAIVDKWEVSTDDEKPELFENPNFLSIFVVLDFLYSVPISQQIFQVLKRTAESGDVSTFSLWSNFVNNLKNTDAVDASGNVLMAGSTKLTLFALLINLQPPSWPGTTALTGQLALKFFAEEYFRGRTNFLHSKYTLKHTTLVPDTYTSDVADFNVEQIYTIPQLLTEVQNPTLWTLPLPPYLAYKILNYPVPLNMPPQYAWGALKGRSNAVVAARGRIEITQSYFIDAISVPTYGFASV